MCRGAVHSGACAVMARRTCAPAQTSSATTQRPTIDHPRNASCTINAPPNAKAASVQTGKRVPSSRICQDQSASRRALRLADSVKIRFQPRRNCAQSAYIRQWSSPSAMNTPSRRLPASTRRARLTSSNTTSLTAACPPMASYASRLNSRNWPLANARRSCSAFASVSGKRRISSRAVVVCTTRSNQVSCVSVLSRLRRSSRRSRISASAAAMQPGEKSVSASAKSRNSASAVARERVTPACSAWTLPTHPSGQVSISTISNRSSPAISARANAAVSSVQRSSASTNRTCG